MGRKETLYWQKRVMELEGKVETLRLSRRVLMRLLEQSEAERIAAVAALTRENQRLQKHNAGFAMRLMAKNIRIQELSNCQPPRDQGDECVER